MGSLPTAYIHKQPVYPKDIAIMMSFLNKMHKELRPSAYEVFITKRYSQLFLAAGVIDSELTSEIISHACESSSDKYRYRFYKDILRIIFRKVTVYYTNQDNDIFPKTEFREVIRLLNQLLND